MNFHALHDCLIKYHSLFVSFQNLDVESTYTATHTTSQHEEEPTKPTVIYNKNYSAPTSRRDIAASEPPSSLRDTAASEPPSSLREITAFEPPSSLTDIAASELPPSLGDIAASEPPLSLNGIAAFDPDPDFDTDSIIELIRKNNDSDSDFEYKCFNIDDIQYDDCGGEEFKSCHNQS